MAKNNLLDFLQGASNSVASNVSAPVDGIAWLLRKAGLPIPSNPVGGSDWIAQRGLTAEPQNKIAGLLGESFGGVAPMLAAAKAPQIAKGLLQGGENLAAPRQLGSQAGVIRHGQSTAEWAGTNTPEYIGGNHANDMMQILKEDISTKDFDPSGVRQGLINWSSESNIHPRYALQSFIRNLNADKELSQAHKSEILQAMNP